MMLVLYDLITLIIRFDIKENLLDSDFNLIRLMEREAKLRLSKKSFHYTFMM